MLVIPFSRRSDQLPRDAGIVIGPILFVLALLAVLAVALSSNTSNFGTASVTDRVAVDVGSQANLIRTKIIECNTMYGSANTSNYDGYPSSDATNGTLVSDIECEGDSTGQKNLWTGARTTSLPQPTNGFGAWYYINTNASGHGGSAAGGRCIWVEPTMSDPVNSTAIVEGLTRAASKFTHGASYSSGNEVIYDPTSTSQKFVMWITLPTGTPDSHCLP